MDLLFLIIETFLKWLGKQEEHKGLAISSALAGSVSSVLAGGTFLFLSLLPACNPFSYGKGGYFPEHFLLSEVVRIYCFENFVFLVPCGLLLLVGAVGGVVGGRLMARKGFGGIGQIAIAIISGPIASLVAGSFFLAVLAVLP